MYKVGVGTYPPHAQIKFLKQEIKQKRFRNTFEIKKTEMQYNLNWFSNEIEVEI